MDLDKTHDNRPGPADPVSEGQTILAEAVERYGPVKVFALCSGGHDTLCTAHLASRTPSFDSAFTSTPASRSCLGPVWYPCVSCVSGCPLAADSRFPV